jgi:nudix-type nucleoside diphosphatase (YffH/AdpP family)
MNARVRPVGVEVLSDDWYVLRKATFDFRGRDGRWERVSREAYDRGNGAVILLGDAGARTVLLTRQFRWPAYANGHPDGMLIEAPAGLLDGDDPARAIRREVAEETGVAIGPVTRLFEVYMSPGSVTERLHFFAAPYDSAHGVPASGGLADEGEDIELVELPLVDALAMVALGDIVDAKTIMLLQWAERHGLPG